VTDGGPVRDLPYRPPPIGAHRVLSDGRSTALLTPLAEVDWWCWPRMHSPPLAWSLLDREGGKAWFVGAQLVDAAPGPAGPTTRTTLRIEGVTVEVWDGMLACGDGSDLVRLVRAIDVPLHVVHAVRLGGFDVPPLEWEEGQAHTVDGRSLLVRGGATTFGRDGTALTTLHAAANEWAHVSMQAHGEDHDPGEIVAAFERAERVHQAALAQCHLPSTHAERAQHALAVIEACTDRMTGAALASPTTSLPEVAGGDRQFDYRYAWLRDGAAAVAVASLLGRSEAIDRTIRFLERLGPAGILRAPVCDIDGEPVPDERTVPCVDGWARSRPVRVGNDAAHQLQYDALGFALDALLVLARDRRRTTASQWDLVRTLADRCTESPDEPSNGIWEIRRAAPLVSADIGRWLALDRALRIARMARPWSARRRWRQARARARERVLSAIGPDGTLPHAYGEDGVDSSALLLVVFGLLPASDPRAGALVDGTLRALGSGPLLYRYPPDGRDGFSPGEAPFVPASWWAVTALARLGRADAQERADAMCGMLPALLPEQFDPVRAEALGNTPLVWSHAECARALFELDRQRRWNVRARRRLATTFARIGGRSRRFARAAAGAPPRIGADRRDEGAPPMSDVVDLIEHDHREVEQMFAEFKASPAKAKALEICDELDKHTRAEDEAVYPVFEEELRGAKDKVHEAEDEHKEARQLIGRIRNTEDVGHLTELMNQLEQAIQHHVKEEESEMLPQARNELPAEELGELGERFEAAKEHAR
jgi:hypothetical protein